MYESPAPTMVTTMESYMEEPSTMYESSAMSMATPMESYMEESSAMYESPATTMESYMEQSSTMYDALPTTMATPAQTYPEEPSPMSSTMYAEPTMEYQVSPMPEYVAPSDGGMDMSMSSSEMDMASSMATPEYTAPAVVTPEPVMVHYEMPTTFVTEVAGGSLATTGYDGVETPVPVQYYA
ncbi:hypothetical protein ABW19_dt0202020 [Dactylella cylindrospora]|nr:hypothetical protein ABW19_dt0202020 [Dactylella cylindrospora]